MDGLVQNEFYWEMMVEYYALRADSGLIITEAAQISEQAAGWDESPGIHTDTQVKEWQKITEAVHCNGGRIMLQLWHSGRASHPDFQPGGVLPVSASADGVNQRTDAYGGSIANRARFLLEVTEAVVNAWSADRVGVKLSPNNDVYNDMRDSNPYATFTYAASALNAFNLAFLDVQEPLPGHPLAPKGERYSKAIRSAYKGVFMVGGGYDAELGEAAINKGDADLVAYGVPFIANPDLVKRFRLGASLNPPDPTTFYTRGEKGYLDYPLLTQSPSYELPKV